MIKSISKKITSLRQIVVTRFVARRSTSQQAGFTLFELLITIGIVTIITGIVLFNQSKFKNDIEITNLAYRMAIAAREAQVYSISVKQYGSGQNFNASYGLHFDRLTPDAVILFADADGNGIYTSESPDENSTMECDPGPDSECVEKLSIGRGNIIKGWCGVLWIGMSVSISDNCFYNHEETEYRFLDIQFMRPNPDALFKVYKEDQGGNDEGYVSGNDHTIYCEDEEGNNERCSTAWAICLDSPDGLEKMVLVYETGQISVEDVPYAGEVCYERE